MGRETQLEIGVSITSKQSSDKILQIFLVTWVEKWSPIGFEETLSRTHRRAISYQRQRASPTHHPAMVCLPISSHPGWFLIPRPSRQRFTDLDKLAWLKTLEMFWWYSKSIMLWSPQPFPNMGGHTGYVPHTVSRMNRKWKNIVLSFPGETRKAKTGSDFSLLSPASYTIQKVNTSIRVHTFPRMCC